MDINKFVSAIIILVISLMITFLFVLPKYYESNEVQNELTTKQTEYESKVAYYAKIKEIIDGLESKRDILEKVDNALPNQFSFAPLIYFLQRKGDENGILIRSIAFSQNTPDPLNKDVKSAAFAVDITGNYQGLKNFLMALDKSERLFEVNSISFISPKTNPTGSQQIYDFKLIIETHTY